MSFGWATLIPPRSKPPYRGEDNCIPSGCNPYFRWLARDVWKGERAMTPGGAIKMGASTVRADLVVKEAFIDRGGT
jgi:hypothetical protein